MFSVCSYLPHALIACMMTSSLSCWPAPEQRARALCVARLVSHGTAVCEILSWRGQVVWGDRVQGVGHCSRLRGRTVCVEAVCAHMCCRAYACPLGGRSCPPPDARQPLLVRCTWHAVSRQAHAAAGGRWRACAETGPYTAKRSFVRGPLLDLGPAIAAGLAQAQQQLLLGRVSKVALMRGCAALA